MKRLLQQIGTGLWVAADGSLTADRTNAILIDTIEEAVTLCREHHLKNIDIVLLFSSGHESRIPMGDIFDPHKNLIPGSP